MNKKTNNKVSKFKSNKERISYLLKLFEKKDKVLILIWADPDSLSSAFAFKRILQNRVERVTIANVNEITRLNNKVMVEVLKIPLVKYSPKLLEEHNKFVLVDSQPSHREEFKNVQWDVIIDHHPLFTECTAKYYDIRPDYGATATILYEYLKTLKIKPSVYLATALVYGIKTDTDNFEKSANLHDVIAFQKLYKFMNKHLLSKIESASLRRSELRYVKIALDQLKFRKNRMFTYVGKVSNTDVLVLIADFLNKVYETSWVFVAGEYKKVLTIIIRCDGYKKNAGKMANRLFKDIGFAGGHREKARAEIPFSNLSTSPELFNTDKLIKLFDKYFKLVDKKEKVKD
ncbi:phosphoethanolamine methyltransferase [Thermodesulfobacterium sp. TA1]|uniref:DHH family phosphoesterase n=1 Tax=Thermodesulfobacterium sp. TA1 TaxID=2234087 RepID=UPI001232214A|nr:DHH family phosphoesterase [Thermodesulfobacterium sp. TA1]QER41245.1 phosphoethanolamine methyltransferase [Thermodesulfobacterium sp. TA1]